MYFIVVNELVLVFFLKASNWEIFESNITLKPIQINFIYLLKDVAINVADVPLLTLDDKFVI